MSPELVINASPLDLEITAMLGNKPSDFLVLCFNGEQFEGFGTPYDTPDNRARQEALIARLNDRSVDSLWPEMFRQWKENICLQFGLKPETTDEDFRPVVSYKISRVCPGYSEHLPVAVHLFKSLEGRITSWCLELHNGRHRVEIVALNGNKFCSESDHPARAVAMAARLLLLSCNPADNRKSAIANQKSS